MQDRIQNISVLYVNIYPVRTSEVNKVEFLLLRRRDDIVLPSVWQPVSGKLKSGEKISAAFSRQVVQKTGIEDFEVFASDSVQIYYDLYYDTVMAVPRAIATLKSDPTNLDGSLHTEFKWVSLNEFQTLVPFPEQSEFARFVNRAMTSPNIFSGFKKVGV